MDGTRGMIRARAIAVALILFSYGAVGARQPAVRTSIPLPIPAEQLAGLLGLDPTDRSQLLISIVRLVFDAPDGFSVEDQKRRTVLSAHTKSPASPQDRVPLPLDTSIWRETLLQRQVSDSEIARVILSDRTAALLYHGLAALDDDTLGWLGPDRETLVHLRRHAAIFAAFGRSIKVRAGRVAVPGGAESESLWAAIVGADPARPSAFVQRLITGNGRLAWFYDTVLHLDPNRRQFVLGGGAPEHQRAERLRRLLDVFESAAPEWLAPERPFVRPALDPSLVISLAAVTADGALVGPSRRVWEAVFRDDAGEVTTAESGAEPVAEDNTPVEPGWLARRLSLVPGTIGRRRLETLLFAQRVFSNARGDNTDLVGALRGAAAFPALALTLERMAMTGAEVYATAARTAAALNGIRSPEWRRVAVAEFQSALAIIDRSARTGGINSTVAGALTSSLLALPVSAERGYGPGFVEWLRRELVPALPIHADAADPVEEAILHACAGVRDGAPPGEVVEWEGRSYRVDPAAAELKRLRRVRERQRAAIRGTARAATTLDARLAAATAAGAAESRRPFEQALAETLTSIVYAAYLGEPDGAAASAGDVATRHDFGLPDAATPARNAAWRFAREEHGERAGWRLVGSLLGLEVPLGRLALRRLDLSDMPGEPAMNANERTTAMLTVAAFGPLPGSDSVRDEISAAIGRGRARVAALRGDRADVDRVARDAGLSEWRREALGWTLEHEREKTLSRFSLLELFWLGSPRGASSRALDAWGASTLLLDGCLCLRMPAPEPWESRAGRASRGHLATYGADVTLRVAELLTELKLSGALAPAIVAYAMQDVVDLAHPAYFDDWPAFQRTARDLPRERLIDYIAAVASDGALVPITTPAARH